MRFLALFLCFSLLAAPARLTWDPTPEADLAGYRVYWGGASRQYRDLADTGSRTPGFYRELPPGTYFFAVTAFNTQGLESDYSNEVVLTLQDPPPKPPAPILGAIPPISVKSGSWSGTVTLKLADPDTSILNLTTWASTDNPGLITAFSFTDARAVRRLRVQSAAKKTGTARVTVFASDGVSTVSQVMLVTVVPR